MRTVVVLLLVRILAFFRNVLMRSHAAARLLFLPGFEKTRWAIGKMKAYAVFCKARRQVPAYKNFLKTHGTGKIKFRGLIPVFDDIPVTNKESYIKKYSIGERCNGGQLPAKGVMIDESSGSSGIPTNWIRGKKERDANKKMLLFGFRELLGKGSIYIINAFAMGTWATGMNISLSFVNDYLLKSTGPDICKIENTLHFFGPSYSYVIMGYPPFLKSLADSARVDWKEYDITFIFGGEGMSEGMRSYLANKGIRKIYGSLGASDLELNIGAENEFTVSLRKLLLDHKELGTKLVRYPGSLPMIFQYNPLDFYIESTTAGELLITLCRPYYLSPKIRYNIHDIGHVLRMDELKDILGSYGIDIKSIKGYKSDLPLLFHYGRSDLSVAYFGCKISPSDIQEAIFRIPEWAGLVSSFTLITYEDEAVNKKLLICLEIMGGQLPISDGLSQLSAKLFAALTEINQDFRESLRMLPAGYEPVVECYAAGTGPFAGKDVRIKMDYIRKKQ